MEILRLCALYDYKEIYGNTEEWKSGKSHYDTINYVKKMRRPRFIKTHLPWTHLPEEIRNGEKKPRVILQTLLKNISFFKYFR